MEKQKSRYTMARNIFLILFLLSTALLVILFLSSTSRKTLAGATGSRPDATTLGEQVAAVASCVTSVITLVGFISTTVLAWRKESRETRAAELERKQKELELERERLELERLKAKQEEQRSKDAGPDDQPDKERQ